MVATQICAQATPFENPFVQTFSREGGLELHIPTREQLPFYQPPRTPISFAVRFEKAMPEEAVSAARPDGSPVAFQWSHRRKDDEGNLQFARLHLSASPGETFVVTSGTGTGTGTGRRAAFGWQDDGSHYVRAGGRVVVSIPKGGAADGIPGPVRSLALGDLEMGAIVLRPGRRTLESVRTQRIAQGPIFTEFRTVYTFDNAGSYEAVVSVSPDLPFVSVSESVQGLSEDDGVTAEVTPPGFELRGGSRRRVAPGSPGLMLDSPAAGASLAVFVLKDPYWGGGASPLVCQRSEDGGAPTLKWALSAEDGATSTRHFGLALHDSTSGLAQIAAHPPGRVPRSTDTYASWLYHYHSRFPLDATKDWVLDHPKVRPAQLFNAYRTARLRLDHQYPQLAATAARAVGHPMAREWTAQAASVIARHTDHHAASGDHDHDHDHGGHVDLGPYSLEAHPHDDGAHVALSSGTYRVVIETLDNGRASLRFPGDGPEARNVLVTTPGDLSVATDGALEHVALGRRAVAVIGAATVNGAVAGPNFRPGAGIRPAPDDLPLRVGAGGVEELVFFGDAESGRLQSDGEGFAFDGELGIASGDSLVLFSTDRDGPVSNRIANANFTLATEGVGVAASFAAAAGAGEDAPAPVAGRGMFDAPHGGTLKLRFAPPEPAIYRPRGSLMAFWKFDEPTGRSVANEKAPALPAQVVGGGAEPVRDAGVGFGEARSLVLDPGARIETFFDSPLPPEHTVAVWVKTTSPCAVWSKALGGPKRFDAGSRWLHIDADGDAIATVVTADGAATLRANANLLDGDWHHIAWVAERDGHRLLVDGEPSAEAPAAGIPAPPAPMRLGGSMAVPAPGGATVNMPGLDGAIDNVRVYDMALRDHEVAGIRTVGVRLAPIVITSTPATELLVGETFNYDLEFTGAPYVQFRFNGMPDWMSFQGRLTGAPGPEHLGESGKIIITGLCPWGPAQQDFRIDVKPPLVGEDWKAYVDGRPVETRRLGYGIEFDLPEGSGHFEFTNGTPMPRPTSVLRAVESPDALEVQLRESAGATSYSIRISADGGASWTTLASGASTKLTAPLPEDGDYLLVARARNGERASSPSEPFAAAVTRRPPPPPRTLELELATGEVTLCWEAVAGAGSYTVYRRNVSAGGGWSAIHTGAGTHFTDRSAAGAVPRFHPPGLRANADRDLSGVTIYEYAVSASNGVGESERGAASCSDPRAW